MKSTNQVKACVIDHGHYQPLAHRLAKDYDVVWYYSPWEEAYPKVDRCCIGDGFGDIERCNDIWDIKDDVDLFVFPDILHSGLQQELIRQGYPVWGSGTGDSLELDRMKFLKTLQDVGLPLPTMKEVRGVSALREHLRDQKDKYIKISKYRGTMETFHWRDYESDRLFLDHMALKLGAVSELLRFLVCDRIDTDIEIGADTYCIDGQFPSHMMEAYEWKDKSAFGTFKPVEETADCIQEVLQAFGPVLASHSYRNYFSMEIRVKGDQFYFLDPCCRGPLPMTWSQTMIYGNLGEIVWAGAHGELVDPEPTDLYCCECILTWKGDKESWPMFRVPSELKDAMKISGCCCAQGLLGCPSEDEGEKEVGWLVATGPTPRETLNIQLEQAKRLPDGMSAATQSLVDLLREIDDAEKSGLEFTDHPLPKPDEAIESN